MERQRNKAFCVQLVSKLDDTQTKFKRCFFFSHLTINTYSSHSSFNTNDIRV